MFTLYAKISVMTFQELFFEYVKEVEYLERVDYTDKELGAQIGISRAAVQRYTDVTNTSTPSGEYAIKVINWVAKKLGTEKAVKLYEALGWEVPKVPQEYRG